MFIFELMVALLKTVAGNYTLYPKKEKEEINEPRVMDPEDLQRILESDESNTYSCSGDPADRIRDWEEEAKRNKIEEENTKESAEPRDIQMQLADFSDMDSGNDVQTTLSDFCDTSAEGSFWDSQCSDAAESMGGGDSDGGDGGSFDYEGAE